MARQKSSIFFFLSLFASAADVCFAGVGSPSLFLSVGTLVKSASLRTLAARSFSSMYAVTLAILRDWWWRREGGKSGADGRKGDVV